MNMNPSKRPFIDRKDLQKLTFPFWGHYFCEGIFGSLAPFVSACLAFKGLFHYSKFKNGEMEPMVGVLCENTYDVKL